MYILGMAKSTLQFKAGQRRNLELDVLRLIYFVNMFEKEKTKIFGFMIVYNEEIKNLIINKWFKKYNFKNINFEVLTFENEKDFIDNKVEILIEKKNNSNFNNSNSDFSKEIVENILANKIKMKFGNDNLHDFQLSEINGIQWDFKKIFIP